MRKKAGPGIASGKEKAWKGTGSRDLHRSFTHTIDCMAHCGENHTHTHIYGGKVKWKQAEGFSISKLLNTMADVKKINRKTHWQ